MNQTTGVIAMTVERSRIKGGGGRKYIGLGEACSLRRGDREVCFVRVGREEK